MVTKRKPSSGVMRGSAMSKTKKGKRVINPKAGWSYGANGWFYGGKKSGKIIKTHKTQTKKR